MSWSRGRSGDGGVEEVVRDAGVRSEVHSRGAAIAYELLVGLVDGEGDLIGAPRAGKLNGHVRILCGLRDTLAVATGQGSTHLNTCVIAQAMRECPGWRSRSRRTSSVIVRPKWRSHSRTRSACASSSGWRTASDR